MLLGVNNKDKAEAERGSKWSSKVVKFQSKRHPHFLAKGDVVVKAKNYLKKESE